MVPAVAEHSAITKVPPSPFFLSQSPATWLEFQCAFASLEIQLLINGFENKEARSPLILMCRMHPSNNAIKLSDFPSSLSSHSSQKTV